MVEDDTLITIDTSKCTPYAPTVTLAEAKVLCVENDPYDETLVVRFQAYNRLDRSKNALGYLLKYTKHIDYQLVLVDNGSTDGTLDFFKELPHPKKVIYHFTKNAGANYPDSFIREVKTSKYYMFVLNDAYLMHQAVDNFLACMESDHTIGMVTGQTSQFSNFQDPDLSFSSLEDMEEQTQKLYQGTHPHKWEERKRLLGIGNLIRKVLWKQAGGIPTGYFYDFVDDEVSLNLSRAGVKQMLCNDAFIHHDHDYSTEKDPKESAKSLKHGRENYRRLHYGLDAWDDMAAYNGASLNLGTYTQSDSNVLGIDVQCGVSIYEILQKYRENGTSGTKIHGFCSQVKHYRDMKDSCQGQVICDNITSLVEHYQENSMDMILLGTFINTYQDMETLLLQMKTILKPGGQLFIKLKNTQYYTLIPYICALGESTTHSMASSSDFTELLQKYSLYGQNQRLFADVPPSVRTGIERLLKPIKGTNSQNLEHLFVDHFIFHLSKQ